MTSPSPHPLPNSLSTAKANSAQSNPTSTSSSSSSAPATTAASSASAQPPQSAPAQPTAPWSFDHFQSRRGLAPITTSTSHQGQSRPSSSSQSQPPRNPWSPSANPLTASQSKPTLRSASISSAASSPFSAPPGSQTHQSSSSSAAPKSRTIASSGPPSSASAAAALQTTGGAGGPNSNGSGGGGTNSSNSGSKNIRASPSLSGSAGVGSPTASNSINPGAPLASTSSKSSGSLSGIVVAQLFLLLSTIKEDKESPRWEQEADKIRKLVQAHGMDVFTKYFRRLLVQNGPQIWGSNRNVDSSGSYPILVSEVQKVAHDPHQAAKIVESVEFGEGEIFKDFDMFTFMEHFKLSPFGKVTLASAFRRASKPDLRTKADAIISNNFQNFLNTIATQPPSQPDDDSTNDELLLATILDRLAQDPPRNWSNELHQNLLRAFDRRYHGSSHLIPPEVSSTLALFDLVTPSTPLVRLIQKHTSKATESLDSCKSMLETVDMRDISYQQVASALLFMVIARDEPPYDPSIFVSALRDHRGGQKLDWQDVLHALDREGLKITKSQFKRLFDALLPLSQDLGNFDLQLLWGGEWRHEDTQLGFVSAFLAFSESELDASKIPRLRTAFSTDDFDDASDDIKSFADTAVRHPLASLDATKALFGLVFQSSETYTHAQSFGVVDNIINPSMDLFVGAVSAVPKPWGALQDQAIKQLVGTLLFTPSSGRGFALHLLWKRDKPWLSTRLFQLYQQNSMHLIHILELAHEHGWLEDLIRANTELSLDLAALAHGRHLFDLETWLQQITQAMQRDRVVPALCAFLNNKIEDEIATNKDKSPPRTVPLAVRTAHAILTFLGNEGLPETERTQLQRSSIQAYPRLINYGEGFDDIIEANGQESNTLPSEADAKMQEHYKEMYGNEVQVRDIVETLQRYKMSREPAEQDLFACMIFGLFDEYNCFAEYPLAALATTAVLFGSIINFNLLSKVALQVAISMVLEAVREYQPEESMYKFGLQALINFQDRLDEWTRLSEILLEIPGLQGTPIYPVLEKIAKDREETPNVEQSDADRVTGAADDFLAAEPNMQDFSCLSVDPPARLDFYEEPDEQVQEGVLFILNNVSERNLKDKSGDLKSNLEEKNHQWFANYLVESRIKSQPNFHQLYMDILLEFDNKNLWFEVLRETYVLSVRMLNSEATMNSSNERSHLKNIGAWLGAMTLARNNSIRHKNISFRDLLIEAHDSQRLLVAIPFTCKVLSTASQSDIFKPPCSWTMEVLHILIELYHHSDLKLNLKFEIEVLCKTLEIDHKQIKPSNVIRSRPVIEDEMLPPVMTDGVEAINDLPLIHLPRARALTERFSPANIIPQLAELSATLKHHYSLPPMNVGLQNRIRQLLSEAVERAISEIIGPVVERSVTIAGIAASQLIAKDFALEPNENRYRESAHTSVRALAASLAGVTCKEPLRVSMQNNIAHMRQDLPEQTLPQGSAMMFVNDNLETVCSFVEKAAETASLTEIDAQIDEALQARQRPNFIEPQLSKWAYYIPEPYKPTSGGLNHDQLAIYEDFSKAGIAFPSHSSISQETVRQMPDVLQDPFSNSMSAADPIMPSSSVQPPFGDQAMRPTPEPHSQPLVNGFLHGQALETQTSELVNGLRQAAAKAIEEDPSRPLSEVVPVREAWVHLFRSQIVATSPPQKHETAVMTAREVAQTLVQAQDRQEVLDLLAQALRKLCEVSEVLAQYIYTWSMDPHQERLFNVPLTVALLRSGLLDVHRLDIIITAAIEDRKPGILNFLKELIETYWLADSPSMELRGAWRADLASSMAALTQWTAVDSNLTMGEQIKQKLQDPPANLSAQLEDQSSSKEVQYEYTFDEWVRLQMNDVSLLFSTSFAQQLSAKNDLDTREGSLAFVRSCINASVISYEQAEGTAADGKDASFVKIDAFAKLIVLMMLHHTKANDSSKPAKLTFLEDTLPLVVLVFAQHYQQGGDIFNQRVYYRLFSSLICELHSSFLGEIDGAGEMHQRSMQAVAKCLGLINPKIFPAFSFSWLSLISHRLFMPALLRASEEESRSMYSHVLGQQLSYVGELMKPLQIDYTSKDYYRGTLRLLLVLHHDFPQFLAEYHLELLNKTPTHCTQMRSLIISASPAFPEFPDPFHDGLKVDRLEESQRSPIIRGGLDKLFNNQELMDQVNNLLATNEPSQESLTGLIQAINNPQQHETGPGFSPVPVDVVLLNSLVVYIVQQAEVASRPRPVAFVAASAHAQLLDALIDSLNAEGRYYLLGAMVNQLRYPNSHTHYFSFALFHLYRPGATDRLALDIQQQIIRVLLERIVANRPHPWGLMVVLLEFLKNRTYHLWDTPFVKAAPEVDRMLSSLLQQMGQGARA